MAKFDRFSSFFPNHSFHPTYWSHHAPMVEKYQIEQGDGERYHRKLNSLIDRPHPTVYDFLEQVSGLFAEAKQAISEVHVLGGDTARRDINIEARKDRIIRVLNDRHNTTDQISVLKSIVTIADDDLPFKKIPKMLKNRLIRSAASAEQSDSAIDSSSENFDDDSNISMDPLIQLNMVPTSIQTFDELGDDSNDFIYDHLNLPNTFDFLSEPDDNLHVELPQPNDDFHVEFLEEYLDNELHRYSDSLNQPSQHALHDTNQPDRLEATEEAPLVVRLTRAQSIKKHLRVAVPPNFAEKFQKKRKTTDTVTVPSSTSTTSVDESSPLTEIPQNTVEEATEVPKKRQYRKRTTKGAENVEKPKRKYTKRAPKNK